MKLIPSISKQFRVMIALLILAILSFHPQTVSASCAESGDPEAELNRSDAVFSGTVVYISSANALWMNGVIQALTSMGFKPADFYETIFPGRKIVFVVDRSWKGVETTSVTIRTGYNTGNSSGYPFEVGEYYLVYASHAYGDPEKYLLTSLCHRTQKSPNASEDIAYLSHVPTLDLDYSPAIVRTIDGNLVVATLLVAGFVYVFQRRKK